LNKTISFTLIAVEDTNYNEQHATTLFKKFYWIIFLLKQTLSETFEHYKNKETPGKPLAYVQENARTKHAQRN